MKKTQIWPMKLARIEWTPEAPDKRKLVLSVSQSGWSREGITSYDKVNLILMIERHEKIVAGMKKTLIEAPTL